MSEAARQIGVNPSTVCRWRRCGDFPVGAPPWTVEQVAQIREYGLTWSTHFSEREYERLLARADELEIERLLSLADRLERKA